MEVEHNVECILLSKKSDAIFYGLNGLYDYGLVFHGLVFNT